MGALLGLSRGIDRVNLFIGRCVSWLVLAAVLISAGNAIVRKLFNTSSNAWLEVQWYLFGAIVLLGAAAVVLVRAPIPPAWTPGRPLTRAPALAEDGG